jgi:hypothetical protein
MARHLHNMVRRSEKGGRRRKKSTKAQSPHNRTHKPYNDKLIFLIWIATVVYLHVLEFVIINHNIMVWSCCFV